MSIGGIDAMRMAIIAIHPRPVVRNPVDPPTMREFEELLNALDLRKLTRPGWDRMKEIIVEAMVESCLGGSRDADSRGLHGFMTNLTKWEACEGYDGRS